MQALRISNHCLKEWTPWGEQSQEVAPVDASPHGNPSPPDLIAFTLMCLSRGPFCLELLLI